MRTAAMGMAVFMKTVEEAQVSGRDETANNEAPQGGEGNAAGGSFPSRWGGAGVGRGRSPALWHLFPSGL